MMPYQVMRLRTGIPASSTWDPANKGANITLSGSNLIATSSNAGMARGTLGRSSGVYQFEVTHSSGDNRNWVGITNSSGNLSFNPGASGGNSWGYVAFPNKQFNGGFGAYGASFTVGDVIGVVVDWTAGTLVFYKNGASQGTAYSTGITGTLYPAWGTDSSGSRSGTLNTGTMVYAVGGATAWG